MVLIGFQKKFHKKSDYYIDLACYYPIMEANRVSGMMTFASILVNFGKSSRGRT